MYVPPDRCFECGAPTEEFHHVVPAIRGGTRTVPLCGLHHGLVHDIKRGSTSELTKEGQRRAVEKGRFPGPTPYGYTKDRFGILLPLVEEQTILDWIQGARKAGFSYRAIADELNEEGVPTKRKGRRWYPSTVRVVLRTAELGLRTKRIRDE